MLAGDHITADANVLAPHADQDSLITIEDNVKQHFVTIENIYIYIYKRYNCQNYRSSSDNLLAASMSPRNSPMLTDNSSLMVTFVAHCDKPLLMGLSVHVAAVSVSLLSFENPDSCLRLLTNWFLSPQLKHQL